jgi:hypothetical protein
MVGPETIHMNEMPSRTVSWQVVPNLTFGAHRSSLVAKGRVIVGPSDSGGCRVVDLPYAVRKDLTSGSPVKFRMRRDSGPDRVHRSIMLDFARAIQ